MTWHVSPEEWLLDFTSVPHGRVRGGESLDPIDDRLRKLLAPPPPKVGLIMPSITAARGPAGRPGAPEPGRGREASQPVLQVRPNEGAGTEPAGTDDPQAGPRVGASVLDVELISLTPVPKASAADLVMPSLTRPASEADDRDDDEARVDEDDEEALDRLNPMSGPELGIPADDADDLMSAMASAAPMMAPTPSSAPEADDVIEEPEEVEGELEAEAIDDEPEPEPEVAADAADEPPLIAEPALTANLPIDEWPTLVNMERPTADKPASVSAERSAPVPVERPTSAPVSVERPTSAPVSADKPTPPRPPPVVDKPPPAPNADKAAVARPLGDKPSPPRPPEKPAIPPPPTKVAPPPPSKAAPPPPAAASTGPRKRGWYDEAFAEHYGSITPLDSELSAELDAAFIRKTAELGAGQTLLDVGCGDGRHCFALANFGLMVSGLDCSLAQLVRASQRNESMEAGVTLLQGDMRCLPRDRQYDVVTCLGSTLGYFESEDQNRQSLQEMVDVLRPGGKLVLHVFNRDYLVAVMPCRSWWQGRGCLVLDVADMNYFTNRMRIHRTVVFEDGRQFEHHMYIRAFSLHELGKMLATMGMRVLEASGSRETRGRFYGATSPEIWLIAQRRDDV
jgi:ubiquinone/menaquinone biosynthesis C-methylase UbiE